MFWGVTLDSGKRYTQVIEKSFHLTMAALGFQNSSALPVTVMVEVEKAQFALCTLQAGKIPQQPLDYAFTEGEEITFYSEGPGEVHLTGYLREDMEPVEFDEEELSEETTSESASSESEDENSTDDENESSDDEEVTLQGLLHGESQGSDDSSSDEWDPSKENPTKKRKKKLANKKMKKKKKTSLEESVDFGAGLEKDAQETENMTGSSDLRQLDVLGYRDEDNDGDDDDDDYDLPVKDEKKQKSPKAKEKQNLKKKMKKKLKKREEKKQRNLKDNNLKILITNENQTLSESDVVSNGVTAAMNGAINNSKMVTTEKTSLLPKKSKKLKQTSSSELNSSNVSLENSAKKRSPEKASPPKIMEKERRIIPGGISVEDIKVGDGKMAKTGQKVSLYYKGILAHNKKQFDACLHGRPFTFNLGKGEVIRGWDLGVAGMKVGGKRKLIIPPGQGYGNKKSGPIPANSTLEFEVQLVKVA